MSSRLSTAGLAAVIAVTAGATSVFAVPIVGNYNSLNSTSLDLTQGGTAIATVRIVGSSQTVTGAALSSFSFIGFTTPETQDTNSGVTFNTGGGQGARAPVIAQAGGAAGTGLNQGFSLTAAAAPVDEVLNLYLGGYNGTFTLSANDGTGAVSKSFDTTQYQDSNGYFAVSLPVGTAATTFTFTETAFFSGNYDNAQAFGASLTAAPEPASLALIGLPALALLRRRRA